MRFSQLANTALVPARNEDDGQIADHNQSQSKFAVSANQTRRKTPTFQEITTHSLPLVLQKLISSNLSSEAQSIILSSWHPTTQKQYQTYLNRWTQYCRERPVSTLTPTIEQVIEFLTTLYVGKTTIQQGYRSHFYT